jgi:hypothetical protein
MLQRTATATLILIPKGEGESAGIPYVYNSTTGESVWKHPNEQLYISKVKREQESLRARRQLEEKVRL